MSAMSKGPMVAGVKGAQPTIFEGAPWGPSNQCLSGHLSVPRGKLGLPGSRHVLGGHPVAAHSVDVLEVQGAVHSVYIAPSHLLAQVLPDAGVGSYRFPEEKIPRIPALAPECHL